MTEEKQTPESVTTGEDTSRRNRMRNRVIEYDDAEPELRAQMQKLMQPIDTDPTSFQAIVTFGNEPLEELGKVATAMVAVQRRFGEQVNVFDTNVDRFGKTVKSWDLGKAGEAIKNGAKEMANAGVKGVVGGVKLGKGFLDAVTGANKRRAEDEKLIAEMQNNLPAMYDQMIRLVDDIYKTEEGIKVVMVEAEKLGVARVEATRKLNVYVGCCKEILRRYAEVYIPEAQQNFDETGDPEDEMYLKDVIKRQDDFINHTMLLEGSRNQGVIAAQQLKQITETMEDQLKKIQHIKNTSQNEWMSLIATAGIAASSLKAGRTLGKADEFGDNIHSETMKWMEETQRITINSKSRGTIDPAKLIEASERLQKMIEAEHTARVERNKMLEKNATDLRQATDKLLDAASASDDKRVLESQEAVKKRQSNDNAAKEGSAVKAPTKRRTSKPAGPAV